MLRAFAYVVSMLLLLHMSMARRRSYDELPLSSLTADDALDEHVDENLQEKETAYEAAEIAADIEARQVARSDFSCVKSVHLIPCEGKYHTVYTCEKSSATSCQRNGARKCNPVMTVICGKVYATDCVC